MYLALLVDRQTSRVSFVCSTEGGMDIEEVAAETPEKILSFSVDPATGYQAYHGRRIAFMLNLEGKQIKQCVALMGTLYRLFIEKDVEMLEINPLIVTDGGDLKCLDAKMGFDGNAVYRHPDIAELRDTTEEDPKELEVRGIFKARADAAAEKLKDVPAALAADREAATKKLEELKAANAPEAEIKAATAAVAALPKDEAAAKAAYTAARTTNTARAAPPLRHAEPFPGKDDAARDISRKNFLALVFCLMIGTAALPHILMRFYTVPSVREARESVAWSLFFISLLYFTAPALAVLVKFDIYTLLVGTPMDQLPGWIARWNAVDPTLMAVADINKDGILQLAEIRLGGDIVVLATPEIGGLPFVISGLVAAGGLAAALSTADGLLLTIANALSHDLYYKVIDPNASASRRVALSKVILVFVALAAAYVASLKMADILFLVSAAFSFAAAAFFPALTLGIFWKRANKWGASLGMMAGLGISFYYMVKTHPWMYGLFHNGSLTPEILKANTWWDIAPISAGIFGVPLGFAVIIIVSLLTKAPDQEVQDLVENVRFPSFDGSTSQGTAMH